jgi:hypothetical protein
MTVEIKCSADALGRVLPGDDPVSGSERSEWMTPIEALKKAIRELGIDVSKLPFPIEVR